MSVNWYVIRSKPNKEEALFDQLTQRGIEIFYPRIRAHPVNPRAKKVKAYFPGYLFVHVDLEQLGVNTLQWMPYAHGLVSFGQEPSTVPDGLVAAIRRRVDEVNRAGGEEYQGLEEGARVYIHGGPFAGYEAIFNERLPGTERVRVLIELLSKRAIPVELNVGQIRVVPQNPRKQ